MELGNLFLKENFFKNYRKKKNVNENFNGVEFIISPVCNLGCEYCYIENFGELLYPKEKIDYEEILNNLSKTIDWFIENNFSPEIELFSGEIFAQEIGYKCCELIYNKYKDVSQEKKPTRIIVPTNYTFLLNNYATNRVEKIIQNFKDIGIDFILSASVDGKYMEMNRPFSYNYTNDYYSFIPHKQRDDDYYDKLFKFNKKYNFGFHPMIYANNMDKWIDNWLWFQDNFKKYGFPFDRIYLLYVRNWEWSDKNIQDFNNFIKFLIQWTFINIFNEDREGFSYFIIKKGYNLLSTPFSVTGRGVGCAIQSKISVRLADLSVFPCHRLMYPHFKECDFIKGENLRSFPNSDLFVAEKTFNAKSQPMCNTCLIKFNCLKGCLGSQYEVNGELFTPIPTVCKLHYNFIYTVAKTLREIGVLNEVLSYTSNYHAYGIRQILELKGGND